MKKAFSGGERFFHGKTESALERKFKPCTKNLVRVDYQRIADEAYERRDEAELGRLDRTTLVGLVLITSLVLLALFLPIILVSDLSHQTLVETLYGMLHAVELRMSGL
jgi:hypothetical protein